jgi:hypothetical protein
MREEWAQFVQGVLGHSPIQERCTADELQVRRAALTLDTVRI